ncbi:hypothetical protein HYD96_00930 [Mycoplasmopsis bovis]|nr:hypothetical protein [Mycoplasmopsis bovis]QQH34616.1 hypothetical protein HYD96_00930 [Mycoplasmopsis bovis]
MFKRIAKIVNCYLIIQSLINWRYSLDEYWLPWYELFKNFLGKLIFKYDQLTNLLPLKENVEWTNEYDWINWNFIGFYDEEKKYKNCLINIDLRRWYLV